MRMKVFPSLALVLALALALAASAWSQGPTTLTFEETPAGQMPAGWVTSETTLSGPVDKPPAFQVVEHEGGKVLQGQGPESQASDKGYLLYGGSQPLNFDLSVKMKLVDTTLDDKHIWAGLVFRFQDPSNYYGAQMDWEKDTQDAEIKYNLNAVDQQIFEIGTGLPFQYPTAWHTLRVRFDGVEGEFWMDGKSIWKGKNAMFTTPGQVGVFVSNGATVLFDDFRLEVLPGASIPAQAARLTTASGWTVQTIDTGGRYALQSSLDVGGGGGPMVAYFDQARPAYVLARQEGEAWTSEVVDDGTQVGGEFETDREPPLPLLSLKVGEKGVPHLAYVWEAKDPTKARYAGFVAYATKDEHGSWIVSPVEVSDRVKAWYPTMDLAEEGKPYTAFLNYIDGTVNVASMGADGVWKAEQVSGTDKAIGRGSVFRLGFVAAADQLEFAFPNESDDTLEIAWGQGANYQFKELSSDPAGGAWPSMARDAQGVLHVAHFSIDKQGLLYTRGTPGGEFRTVVVDQGGVVGLHPSLQVDSTGRPHVAYYDATNGTVKYGWLEGDKWTLQDTGAMGQYPSLALDAQDRPHISYYDQATNSIRYATR